MLDPRTDATKERVYERISFLPLVPIAAVWNISSLGRNNLRHREISVFSGTERSQFSSQFGGYQVSTDFMVDSKDHAVISLPVGARPGDLLSIRPLRLNSDEYLILQKCANPDCAEADVVRVWNAHGPIGQRGKVTIKAGARYMLWMQHIPTKGNNYFTLFADKSPPLEFLPLGPPEITDVTDLQAARAKGPTPITRSGIDTRVFVATFEGGSVVRMQLLRAATKSDATAALHHRLCDSGGACEE
jgi:hypothetical protein